MYIIYNLPSLYFSFSILSLALVKVLIASSCVSTYEKQTAFGSVVTKAIRYLSHIESESVFITSFSTMIIYNFKLPSQVKGTFTNSCTQNTSWRVFTTQNNGARWQTIFAMPNCICQQEFSYGLTRRIQQF